MKNLNEVYYMSLNQFKRKQTHTQINTILILVIFSNILNGTIIDYSTIFFENPQNQSNGENLGGFCNESITLDGFLNEFNLDNGAYQFFFTKYLYEGAKEKIW